MRCNKKSPAFTVPMAGDVTGEARPRVKGDRLFYHKKAPEFAASLSSGGYCQGRYVRRHTIGDKPNQMLV